MTVSRSTARRTSPGISGRRSSENGSVFMLPAQIRHPISARSQRLFRSSRAMRSRLKSVFSPNVDTLSTLGSGVLESKANTHVLDSHQVCRSIPFTTSTCSQTYTSHSSGESSAGPLKSKDKSIPSPVSIMWPGPAESHEVPKEISFLKVMREITEDHDLTLSKADMAFFSCLEQHEQFKYGDSFSQFDSAGICVEVPKGIKMPEASDDAWTFRFGPNERKVILVPEKLTALGLSVISWIFTANEDCKDLFMKLVKAVTFRNCFVERLNPSKATNGTADEGKKIVIPMGWLYTLGVESSFVIEHGKYGDFAAVLGHLCGTIRKTKWPQISPKAIVNRIGSMFKTGNGSQSGNGSAVGEALANEDPVKNPFAHAHSKEYLYLDSEKHLIWDQVSGQEQKIVALNLGVSNGIGGGGQVQETIPYQELQRRVAKAYPVEIINFSHFISLEMKGSSHRSLVSRMAWLREVFSKPNFYPEDPVGANNQGFLDLFMGELPTVAIRQKIFSNPDCKVERRHLKQHNVVEDKLTPSDYIFIPKPESSEGGNAFRVKVREEGLLWKISGPLEDATIPRDDVESLSRDLA